MLGSCCEGAVAFIYYSMLKEQHRALLATLVLLGLMIADQQSFIIHTTPTI